MSRRETGRERTPATSARTRPKTTVQYGVKPLRDHADDWRSAWAREVANS